MITTSFFQLVLAVCVGFVLATLALRFVDKERFERFPSPLVSPAGPQLPVMVQGRDYIPHRLKPTLPPGPAQPDAVESDGQLYAVLPPDAKAATPVLTISRPQATSPLFTLAPVGETPKPVSNLPYAMTNDTYLSFISPDNSGSVTVDRSRLQAVVASKLQPLTAAL